MTYKIRIADLREVVQRRTQHWKPLAEWGPVCAGCGGAEYRLDGYCSLECRDYHTDEDFDGVGALLDAVEAAHEVNLDGTSRPALARLAAALERFDFGDDAVREAG